MQLTQALVSLVPDVEGLRAGLETYRRTFAQTQHEMMLRKLGLTAQNTEADAALFVELHVALTDAMLDMTIFHRRLSHAAGELLLHAECDGVMFQDLVKSASYPDTKSDDLAAMLRWLPGWAARLREENNSGETVRTAMLRANPKYVLRNYLAQQAIESATEGDRAPLQRLMQVLKTPFEEQSEHDELAAKRPEWARHKPGCATLSCSS
jgi:serine/tyrosine/threonine adenylyltransferase